LERAGSERAGPDRCPGALTIHQAADGGLARVRLPGGRLTGKQLRTLRSAAVELGLGYLELTSRGNVQLRGLRDNSEAELSERLAAAGLLPSITHERARNLLASPLSGIDGGGFTDISSLVPELDARLCDSPRLAELSGRFLFALDDGRGDLTSFGADISFKALSNGQFELSLAGRVISSTVDTARVAETATEAAVAFLDERREQNSSAWRIWELLDGAARVAARLGRVPPEGVPHEEIPLKGIPYEVEVSLVDPRCDPGQPDSGQPEPGRAETGRAETGRAETGRAETGRADPGRVEPGRVEPGRVEPGRVGLITEAALSVLAPLGRISASQCELLSEAAAEHEIRVTPWRTVILRKLDNARHWLGEFAAAGLVTEPDSPWAGVTSCTGRPGCSSALADVRTDATRVVLSTMPGSSADLPVHWAGCERRCGRPAGKVIEVLATAEGYEVIGEDRRSAPNHDLDQITTALTAARSR
jgi:precorrin-3B synthase